MTRGRKRKKAVITGEEKENVKEKDSSMDQDEDDLPAPFTPVKNTDQYSHGDLVFAKIGRCLYWPAVFKCYVRRKRRRKTLVHCFDKLTEMSQKCIETEIKNIKPYACSERNDLIEKGTAKHGVEYTKGMESAEEYLRKKALGKITPRDFFHKIEEEEVETKNSLDGIANTFIKSEEGLGKITPRDFFQKIQEKEVETKDSLDGIANTFIKSEEELGKITPRDFFHKIEEEEIETKDSLDGIANTFIKSEEVLEFKTPIKPPKRIIYTKIKKWNMRSRNEELIKWIKTQSRPVLRDILKAKIKSKRHEHFMRGTQKQKNHLKWNAGNGVLRENEAEEISTLLLTWFHEENSVRNICPVGYVFDVWLPEAIIWALAKVRKKTYKVAEKLYLID